MLPAAALHTPTQQEGVAVAATPIATTHPTITPAVQAALANFVTPKTKTPQRSPVPGSVGVKCVNPAVLIASAKRSAIKSSLAASKYVYMSYYIAVEIMYACGCVYIHLLRM